MKWKRYSLRTLLFVTLCVALWLGLIWKPDRDRHTAFKRLWDRGNVFVGAFEPFSPHYVPVKSRNRLNPFAVGPPWGEIQQMCFWNGAHSPDDFTDGGVLTDLRFIEANLTAANDEDLRKLRPPHLKVLKLAFTDVSDRTLDWIEANFELTDLDVRGTAISSTRADAFRRRFPATNFWHSQLTASERAAVRKLQSVATVGCFYGSVPEVSLEASLEENDSVEESEAEMREIIKQAGSQTFDVVAESPALFVDLDNVVSLEFAYDPQGLCDWRDAGSSLKSLRIKSVSDSAAAASWLADLPDTVTRLTLSGTGYGTATALLEAITEKPLQHLSIHSSRLDLKGQDFICAMPDLQSLRLTVPIESLGRFGRSKSLQEISLPWNRDLEEEELAELEASEAIEFIDFEGYGISFSQVMELENMKSLKAISAIPDCEAGEGEHFFEEMRMLNRIWDKVVPLNETELIELAKREGRDVDYLRKLQRFRKLRPNVRYFNSPSARESWEESRLEDHKKSP